LKSLVDDTAALTFVPRRRTTAVVM